MFSKSALWKWCFREAFISDVTQLLRCLRAIFNLLNISPPRETVEQQKAEVCLNQMFSYKVHLPRSWQRCCEIRITTEHPGCDAMHGNPCLATAGRVLVSSLFAICQLDWFQSRLHCSVPASSLNIGQTCMWVRRHMWYWRTTLTTLLLLRGIRDGGLTSAICSSFHGVR